MSRFPTRASSRCIGRRSTGSAARVGPAALWWIRPVIWFQGGPWAYITTDWNIQSAHWPVYAANRLDQGLELVNRLHDGRDELIKAVRPVEWQEDSAYLPLAVAPDMRGNPRRGHALL